MNTLVVLMTLFSANTKEFNLPVGVLAATCFIESSYNVKAIHHDDGGENSVGVCQVKLSTAKWLGFKGTEKQLMKPEINVYYAAKYLKHQLKRYKGDVARALTAYNRGNAIGLTRSAYSDKVLKHLKEKIINERKQASITN
jgi:soluble lytic murein transglycosylase-like protein